MNGKAKAGANGASKLSDDAKRKLREERRAARGTGSIADWSSCDEGLLRELLALVAGSGFAFMAGYTRDRGAYTLRVIGDDAAEPIYVRATEEIDTALQDLIFIYGG
jgi:hypothetical protein